MKSELEIRPVKHADFHHFIDDLARLRISVFREWPYLYDGDMDYERNYLRSYLDNDRTFIIGAFSAGHIVGASTAMPLVHHDDAFAKPLQDAGYDISRIFYFAESVLLPQYRGFGAGRAFFTLREKEALRQGFDKAIFSAVTRDSDALEKPASYAPLDGFWQRIGFKKIADVKTSFAWKDIGEDQETEKPMAFWIKNLT